MRHPQSVALTVLLHAYLSTDHLTLATGKTIAVTISKNKGSFGNPSAGATNATEIGSTGIYYVDLSTTDCGTLGPLKVMGTGTGIDVILHPTIQIVDAHNAGFDGVPSATAGAQNGLSILNDAIVDTITDASVSASAFKGSSSLSSSDDFYNGCFIVPVEGPAQGVPRKCSAYVGSTRQFQFNGTGSDLDAPYPTSPVNGNRIMIIGRGA